LTRWPLPPWSKATRRPLKRPLQLALSYDEEVGCMAVADLVQAMVGALPKAAAVIVGEPSMMKVVTGHKGGVGFRVHAQGFEVHSSLLPTACRRSWNPRG
jgi:acetylornithine deacetylase